VARGPIKTIKRSTRRGAYKVVHTVLPETVRLKLRRVVRGGAERDQRRAEEKAAHRREKELRIELKQKAKAARGAAKSQPPRP
jgi:hypothetical protein